MTTDQVVSVALLLAAPVLLGFVLWLPLWLNGRDVGQRNVVVGSQRGNRRATRRR